MSRISRRAVVQGRVQGVFFRASTRDRAEQLGVDGWAANRPDGTVEVLAEGEASAVQALLDWLHDGPEYARVEQVEVSPVQPRGERGFRTR